MLLKKLTLTQRLARAWLRLWGWRVEGRVPKMTRYVVVGAPHTSNWDFVWMLLAMLALGVRLNWVGKDELFLGPVGGLMKRLGGIPVNRRSHNNFVAQVAETIRHSEKLALVITPEGTRGRSPYWKTGFYYIALGAGVPIVLGFMDYRRQVVGLGPTLMPTGDIEADMKPIREFYAGMVGKFPRNQGEIKIRPRTP